MYRRHFGDTREVAFVGYPSNYFLLDNLYSERENDSHGAEISMTHDSPFLTIKNVS